MSPRRWIWVAIGVLLLALIAASVGLVLYRGLLLRAYPHFVPFFFFGGFFGFGFLILGLLIVGFALRLIFRPWGPRWGYRGYWGGYGRYYDPAMQALRERYARGDITKEQFEQMSEDLQSH